jgi:hypothetical protein
VLAVVRAAGFGVLPDEKQHHDLGSDSTGRAGLDLGVVEVPRRTRAGAEQKRRVVAGSGGSADVQHGAVQVVQAAHAAPALHVLGHVEAVVKCLLEPDAAGVLVLPGVARAPNYRPRPVDVDQQQSRGRVQVLLLPPHLLVAALALVKLVVALSAGQRCRHHLRQRRRLVTPIVPERLHLQLRVRVARARDLRARAGALQDRHQTELKQRRVSVAPALALRELLHAFGADKRQPCLVRVLLL